MNTNMELPYERFLRSGPGSLTDAELLAILLRTGTQGLSAVDLAKRVLAIRDPEGLALLGLNRIAMNDLMEIPGIGEVKAVKILSAVEISRRISSQKSAQGDQLGDAATIAAFYMERLRHLSNEVAVVVHMDSRNRFLGDDMISVGTADAALLSPREVFLKALERRAVSIVLIHNHPSGDPSPSPNDIEVTEQFRKAGEILGIRLTDHIIIGDLRYRSMLEEGYLR
ncbi:MAG: DNA repair protein RadC [Eubacteriales bacterium]|nr:DNA repair protein RadC [Eubacteriales bacterium]